MSPPTDLNPCPDCVIKYTGSPEITIKTLCPRCAETIERHRPLRPWEQTNETLTDPEIEIPSSLVITKEPLVDWNELRRKSP